MRTFKKTTLAGAAALTLSLGAGSAVAAPYLTPTGATPADNDYVQLLEDGFFEILLRPCSSTTGAGCANGYQVVIPGPTTVLQQGDIFAGVQRIQSTELAAPEGSGPQVNLQGDAETFTTIFLNQVATSTSNGDINTADGSADTQTFSAVSSTVWEAVFGSGGALDISTAFDIGDLDQDASNNAADGATAVTAGTMALLFNGVVYDDADSAGTLSASATSYVDGGVLQHEFGFTGVSGAALAEEFWETNGVDAALPFFAGTSNPQVKLALNITQRWAGPDLEKHTYRCNLLAGCPASVFDTRFSAATHVQGIGAATASPAAGTNWGVLGDLDIYIRPVPEPGSLALFSLGLLGLGLSARRKK